MKVTFIYHSCFVVEMEKVVFVFDYFKGNLPELDSNKTIYVLASHSHQDHFSLEIFEHFEKYPNVIYILSNDIRLSDPYLERHGVSKDVKNNIQKIGKNIDIIVGDMETAIEVETLTSTDQGVAFLIKAENKVIYHAGDLNWWSWKGESEEEYEEMTFRYANEINKLRDTSIDVAFVVLDPRQEERYWWGFDYFMRTVNVKNVFPMHCWEDYSVIQRLKNNEQSSEYRNSIREIIEEGNEFLI